jgi:hypothetical protein
LAASNPVADPVHGFSDRGRVQIREGREHLGHKIKPFAAT